VVYLPQPEAEEQNRHVVIPYPTQAYTDGTAAVARGRSFHHGRLVDSLRKEIRSRPRYRTGERRDNVSWTDLSYLNPHRAIWHPAGST